ncbi:hypothetical protein [Hymenobacter negativus]|uniref:Uncharacterized protein n=1 Tax=Hymenobacter negativus TaxID=2795026 RepID=A0ABS3QI02_9BACT|nr:hypothetical protein [Hymenobacter negativus]MBO2010876.1 hypothetical protein [Hymenobacter negativus]
MAFEDIEIRSGCETDGGWYELQYMSEYAQQGVYRLVVLGADGIDYGGAYAPNALPFRVSGLVDQAYTVTVQERDLGGTITRQAFTAVAPIECGVVTCTIALSALIAHAPTTPGGSDGYLTFTLSGIQTTAAATQVYEQPSGDPVGAAAAHANGTWNTVGLPAGSFILYANENLDVGGTGIVCTLNQPFTIPEAAPTTGCMDEYADNYVPGATSDTTPTSCTYTPRWRSAWQPMAVQVAAVPGQQQAFIEAELFIGFRPGHPLSTVRPYGDPVLLQATVGPQGYAIFRLGWFLRPELGAPDGSGGRRLDLNSPGAYGIDLYVGYELRRTTGELLEHGYAINAAVPDEQVQFDNASVLSPFAQRPLWPGFETYLVVQSALAVGGFGSLASETAQNLDPVVVLPCPLNPLPVAWLAPGGGYGYWVFSGKPAVSDEVEDGQFFNEASTGEKRYSERGASRTAITASSGPFAGEALLAGLRTLARSPQVWYQPVLDGPWVPVTLDSGSFAAGRLGVRRKEISITFTEAAPAFSQGQ